MKVKKRTLLLIACLVWSTAGANILRIGIISYLPFVSLFHLLLSAAVFLLFDRMIFGRLVEKHTLRILSYPEERQMFLRFFDGKSFAIMAGMRSGRHPPSPHSRSSHTVYRCLLQRSGSRFAAGGHPVRDKILYLLFSFLCRLKGNRLTTYFKVRKEVPLMQAIMETSFDVV